MEPIPIELAGESAFVDINCHVSQILCASLGLKLADSIRRVLMYTKKSNEHKGFYALCRGIFPIHELCGALTALQLAKRDILGVNTPNWGILFPAVLLHGMANFRGMKVTFSANFSSFLSALNVFDLFLLSAFHKPIYKWNSATPWTEMQLSPWNAADDDSTLLQMLNKSFAKLVWMSILLRVLGYVVKNYYLIGRQARKLATTYVGKRAAFLAELGADEMLRKSKKDDKKKKD